jgi:hypothetical protein
MDEFDPSLRHHDEVPVGAFLSDDEIPPGTFH